MPVLPACMVIIEGKETYYQAAQYVPLIGAFAQKIDDAEKLAEDMPEFPAAGYIRE